MVFTCPETHKHGETNTCYVSHRCRCQNCKDGCARRAAVRRKAIAYGRHVPPRYVPILRAVSHIRTLQRYGHNYQWIGRTAGVSPRTIWKLNTFHVDRCGAAIEAKILAVRPDFDSLADGHVIPATGVRRRIQALATLGWSQRELSRRLGLHPDNVSKFMESDGVMMRTHRRVAALYDEMWNTPAPTETHNQRVQVSRIKNRARGLGWVPPMGWDDIDTDPEPPVDDLEDFGDYIDQVAVARALEGIPTNLTRHERREAVRIGHSRHWSDSLIGSRLGVDGKTIANDRAHLNLAAWSVEESISKTEAEAA